MNVSLALRASEDTTLAALIADVCQHDLLQMSANALRSATSRAKKEHPFTRTKNDNNYHQRRHAEYLIEIRYLQERAQMLEEINHFLDNALQVVGIDAR